MTAQEQNLCFPLAYYDCLPLVYGVKINVALSVFTP